jgi:DivIVA domain-containing protein
MSDRPTPPPATAAANVGSPPAERLMRVAPLDLRQQRFKTAVRGFDKTEVVAFLTEAADDYEHALREIDRLRQDVQRGDASRSIANAKRTSATRSSPRNGSPTRSRKPRRARPS